MNPRILLQLYDVKNYFSAAHAKDYLPQIMFAIRPMNLVTSDRLIHRLVGSPPRSMSASPLVLPGGFSFLVLGVPTLPRLRPPRSLR